MMRLLAALVLLYGFHAPTVLAQQALGIDAVRDRAEAGDVAAMRALAEAHYLGRGGAAQDFAEAARWYRRLAARGDASAQATLGLLYARGWGLAPNLAEARRWWSLAAAQNDAGAQHNLGMVYLQGQGVAHDLPQALHWFRRAAQSGHVASQRLLGLMYFDGEGTARDSIAGLTWLTIAAESGEEGAQEALRAIGDKATAEQREEARVRARRWLETHRSAR
jgi:uncharacterized protein